MGVPKFFRFITRKYPNVIIKKKPESFINPNVSTDDRIETEVSIEKRSSENFNFSILGVRDILYNDNSNFFTQFGLFNSQVFNDDRVTGNLGLGYRVLTPDENFLFGLNTFYDQEIKGVHSRMSIGAEIKASIIDINANNYMKVTDMKLINDTKEQVLSGFDFNVSTQLPYSPWAILT